MPLPLGTQHSVSLSLFLFALSMLIQYGLSLNYQQEERMLAFRGALELAYDGSGHKRSGHYIRLKDRPIPDIQDSVATTEHYLFGADANVTWTNALAGDYTAKTGELPRSRVEINDDIVQMPNPKVKGFLTTAAFMQKDFDEDDVIYSRQSLDICPAP